MSYNRYGYDLYGNDYSNTSQGFNNYGYQQQSHDWTDQQQYYNNGYNNNNVEYMPRQQKFQNRQNYNYNQQVYPKQQQQHQYQQYNNYNNQQQNNWSNRNKRTHEFVDQSSNQSSLTASPEPKRQVQKQNINQNPSRNMPQFGKTFQHAAYQTPNTQNTHQMPPKFKGSPKKSNAVSPVVVIQEQKATEWAETFKQTMKLLDGCKAGEEVNILISYLQPQRTTWVKQKDKIYNDLMNLMGPLMVEKVLVFGSTLTGLDFHGSDLDYYIQLKTPPSQDEEIRQTISKAAKLTRFSPHKEFQVICTIQNARVPIVRLLHKSTKITCDVNFTSKFGYYNSYFIGHILGYDKRIKDLAVILKLWSKSQKLAQQMIISNYCLVMLLIFYLQNLEEPLLDTIMENQRSRSPMILDMKHKWNFYFNDNINKTKKNQQSLREILVGFFEFYDKITYNDYVLSVYTGTLIPRISFDTQPELEEYRNIVKTHNLPALKADSPGMFIIQDGFELNLNIGIKNKKHSDMFFELIKLSSKKCEELKDKPFSEMLVKLFTDIKLPKSENINKNKKQFQMTIHATGGDLKACQDILLHENPSKIYSADDQQKLFYDHTIEYTQKFLKDYYLCTIIPEISDDRPSNSSFIQSKIRIILQYDTINGRKKMNFKDDESTQSERTLSSKMAEKKINLDLDCLMVISSKDKGKTIDFDMFDNNSIGKKSSLLSFGNYFSINIATALKFYLKQRWDMASTN